MGLEAVEASRIALLASAGTHAEDHNE